MWETVTKKIFQSIFLVSFLVLIACLSLVVGMLYNHYGNIQKTTLETELTLTATAMEKAGSTYLYNLSNLKSISEKTSVSPISRRMARCSLIRRPRLLLWKPCGSERNPIRAAGRRWRKFALFGHFVGRNPLSRAPAQRRYGLAYFHQPVDDPGLADEDAAADFTDLSYCPLVLLLAGQTDGGADRRSFK